MKTKKSLVILLLLCVGMLFGACGSMGSSMLDYMEPIHTQDNVFQPQKATHLTALDGTSFLAAVENYVLVKKTNTQNTVIYTVYDYVAEKTVFEIEDMAAKPDHVTVKLHQIGETGSATVLYSVTVQDQYKDPPTVSTLYRADNGEEVATANAASEVGVWEDLFTSEVGVWEDLFTFDGRLYRVSEGKIETVKNYVNRISFSQKSGSHYYRFERNCLSVYDEKLDFVSGYVLPSYLETTTDQFFVLSDGNVVFQGTVPLPEEATDYHYLEDGKKYRLSTYLFDWKSGDAEELDFPYYIDRMGVDGAVQKDCGLNSAFLYPLVNHTVDLNHMQYVLVDGDLDIKYSFEDLVRDVKDIPELEEDRICVLDVYGNAHYLKWDGTKVKVMNVAWGRPTSVLGQYYVNDVGIYDRDFKLLLEFEESGYQTVAVIGKSILLKKVTNGNEEYTLLLNGEKKVVAPASDDAESYLSCNTQVNLYCMAGENEDGERVCKYYNAEGELIMTSKTWTIDAVFACRTESSRLILLDGRFIRLDQ